MTNDEVAAILKQHGLKKYQFAALLGVDATTASRWFADPNKRSDATPMPRYAIVFALAWKTMTEPQRALVTESISA